MRRCRPSFAGIRYRHTASGRVEIESKEDAKKRGQQSPDRAEALVLSFARAVPRQQTVALSQRVTISPILRLELAGPRRTSWIVVRAPTSNDSNGTDSRAVQREF